MPDKSVQECHCTLLLYSADLVEKWNCLNLRHMCAVKHVVTKGSFCDLTKSLPIRTEKDAREVSLPSFLGNLQSLTMCAWHEQVCEHICAAEICFVC